MKALLLVTAVVLGAAVALYAAVLLMLWRGQERLLFQPERLAPGHRHAVDADVHESWIEVPGARLNALHLRLPAPDGVVFFLHGNAGSLASWFVDPDYYRRINVDLFMIDYRGYGKSSGCIESEAQLLADVHTAWEAMLRVYADAGRGADAGPLATPPAAVARPDALAADTDAASRPPLRRVIYGRSLGSGPAAALAAEVQPALTVLVSPFSSLADLTVELYGWVPPRVLRALLRYPLRTDGWLGRVRGPVLLIHGGRDRLIVPAHSEQLQRVAPQARLLRVPEAGHNDIQDFPAYRNGLAAAIRGP